MKIVQVILILALIAWSFNLGMQYQGNKNFLEGYRQRHLDNLPAPGVKRHKKAMKYRIPKG